MVHFFPKISVAVVELSAPLRTGERVRIEGAHTPAFEQPVDSMQVEHARIAEARPGQSVGMKVAQAVREGDVVLRV
ncbi:translation elongation factor-like protein [Candidatus Micrarchaeota archaeon CG08_land_8_20_14_0_20_59_11]|nr:MAG: translation elongation factor-like protein [Candidatus Micrarchaeota archaeon CG08_land_8_20_14_0_20_59_11]